MPGNEKKGQRPRCDEASNSSSNTVRYMLSPNSSHHGSWEDPDVWIYKLSLLLRRNTSSWEGGAGSNCWGFGNCWDPDFGVCMSGLTGMTTRGCAELGVGKTSPGCWAGSTGSCLAGSLGCLAGGAGSCLADAESGVGSASLGCLAGGAGSCLADAESGVSASGAGSSRIYLYGISGSTGILANSYSYSATSSEVFPRFLILYYLLYTGLYPFYFIRYLVVILRPLEKVRLFSKRSILYDLRVRVSPSIKILLG